jgi:hypothetical protein
MSEIERKADVRTFALELCDVLELCERSEPASIKTPNCRCSDRSINCDYVSLMMLIGGGGKRSRSPPFRRIAPSNVSSLGTHVGCRMEEKRTMPNIIPGTPNGDVIFGTLIADIIDGLAGNDQLHANAGDNRPLGHAGSDSLSVTNAG